MTTTQGTDDNVRARPTDRVAGVTLLTGGALHFIGGGMHPKQDPPGVSLKEHFRVMFEDPAWYPAHALLLVGTILIAVALLTLVWERRLVGVPRAHAAAVVAAIASVAASLGTALHLAMALEADRIAAHEPTPLVTANNVVETITTPAFGVAIAALAVIGAMTRTLGSWLAAPFGVIGGVGFGLAGATFLVTDALDPLFPLAAGISVWAMLAGIGLIRRQRLTG